METSFCTTPLPAIVPQYPATYCQNTQRLTLPYLNRYVVVSLDDIVYLKGEGNYTFIHTRDRRKYLASKTLKDFMMMLNPTIFIRIHKSSIINLAYVQDLSLTRERVIRMVDDREVTISRRRVREIAQLLARYQEYLN